MPTGARAKADAVRSRMTERKGETKAVGTHEEGGFLRRWSRRKAEARADTEAEEGRGDSSAPMDRHNRQEAPAVATTQPERVLTDADMPALESLNENSDYSCFMSPGVSEELRQAALRRLFRSSGFNELCPLEGEYFDGHGFDALGSVVTHEMRAAMEREAAKLREAATNKLTETNTQAPAGPRQEPVAEQEQPLSPSPSVRDETPPTDPSHELPQRTPEKPKTRRRVARRHQTRGSKS